GPVMLVPTISGIFSQVEAGVCDGIVPIENSEAGGVGPTLDGLLQHEVYITAELFMPIHHYLVSRVPLDEIAVLYAHPQTHEQCSRFIDELGVPVIHTSSNAASAESMAGSPASAAIVSRMTAGLHHLPVVTEHVENNPSNTTRFVVISNRRGEERDCTKCSILVDPEQDRAGLLYELLGIFATRNINLTRIESRPSKRGMGRYIFFMDTDYTPGWTDALRALREKARFRELGCYRELEVPAWT
ncbi:MAG: ACT domain-containing protein, partial [Methanomicrobiales archaeon]|nr:ACT domain-containing protein [Methanomicrobiales archaeon]